MEFERLKLVVLFLQHTELIFGSVEIYVSYTKKVHRFALTERFEEFGFKLVEFQNLTYL